MFDIGWTELMVIACVAIIVVGPKDLPRMLRSLGQAIGQMRRMSREFQSTFNDAIREAEKQADIADMKKQVEEVGNFNPLGDLKASIENDKVAQKATTPAPPAGPVPPIKDGKGSGDEAEAPAPAGTSTETAAAKPAASAGEETTREDTKA